MATNGKGKGAVAEEGSIAGLGKGSGLGSGSGSGSGAGGGSSGSGSEPPAPLATQLSSGGGSGNIARPPRGTASKYDFVKVKGTANGSKTMHAYSFWRSSIFGSAVFACLHGNMNLKRAKRFAEFRAGTIAISEHLWIY